MSEVGREVREHDHDRQQERQPHHHRVVARADGSDEVAADPGDAEHGLDDEGSGQEQAEERRRRHHRRDGRIAERMHEHDPPAEEAPRPRGADEVSLECLQHRSPQQPRDPGRGEQCKGQRRQHRLARLVPHPLVGSQSSRTDRT